MRKICAVLASCLLSALPAAAGTLAAGKASELVTLTGFGGSQSGCGGYAILRFLNTRLLADGTTVAFTIPEKKVLILKSGEASVVVSPGAGGGADVALALTDGATLGRSIVEMRVNSEGATRRQAFFTFGDGVAVRTGQKLCFGAIGVNGSASIDFIRVHGFLASDK